MEERLVQVPAGAVTLEGNLGVPAGAHGVVLFARRVIFMNESRKFEIVQTVKTGPGSRTMGLDPMTHTIYLPGAEFEPAVAGARPKAKPGTFKLIVISRDQ